MEQTQKPRIYAFIDSQNLNVSIQKLGWKMNWREFHKFLAEKYGVSRAFMFIGYVPEFEDMYEKLHEDGYSIVLKPTYDMTRPRQEALPEDSPEDKKPVKGNVDVELVLWAMKEISNYDKAIIVSGDGDFFALVEYLESRKKLHKILTPNARYSNLFNKYESYIERIDQHRRRLEYRDKRRFKKNEK